MAIMIISLGMMKIINLQTRNFQLLKYYLPPNIYYLITSTLIVADALKSKNYLHTIKKKAEKQKRIKVFVAPCIASTKNYPKQIITSATFQNKAIQLLRKEKHIKLKAKSKL